MERYNETFLYECFLVIISFSASWDKERRKEENSLEERVGDISLSSFSHFVFISEKTAFHGGEDSTANT